MNEPTPEEQKRRDNAWSRGFSILKRMKEENEWKWKVKRKPKQQKLDL